MKTEPATTKYKRYDAAFKHSAVEHWLLSGKSARIIAGELGISEQSLHKWKQQFKALPAGQVAGTSEQLQVENRWESRPTASSCGLEGAHIRRQRLDLCSG